MSRLDYRRKKQRELERQERGETGWRGFVKRHLGLLVLAVIVVLVSAAALIAALNPDFGGALFGQNGTELYLDENTIFEMPITAGEETVIASMGDTAVFCTREKIMALSGDGRTEWEIPLRLSNPLVSVAGDYILAADRGGKDIYLIHRGSILLQTTSAYNIINASVASDGKFVVISDEPYYKGLVTVRDAAGSEVFIWHSGSFYVIDAVLGSDTNKLALAVINTSLPSSEEAGGSFSGGVLQFNLYETEPFQTHTFDGSLITNVFRAGNGFLAVTDTECVGIAADGTQSWTYSLNGKNLNKISKSDDLTVFALEDTSGRKSIAVLDNNGNERCMIENAPNLSYVSSDADRVAYNNGNNITVCDSAGKELYSIQTVKSFTELLLFDGGRRAAALSASSFDILEIK